MILLDNVRYLTPSAGTRIGLPGTGTVGSSGMSSGSVTLRKRGFRMGHRAWIGGLVIAVSGQSVTRSRCYPSMALELTVVRCRERDSERRHDSEEEGESAGGPHGE